MKQLNNLKPFLRAIKYGALVQKGKFALQLAQIFGEKKSQKITPMTYIVGCGRSGTTILGDILSQHPDITYLFEPYHLWFNVDSRTDALNLFHLGSANLLMSQDLISTEFQLRFRQLIVAQKKPNTSLLVEKTPLNALRIGYLEALSSQAKYIHIVRDGVEVSSSIDRLARGNTYKIAGKPDLNQWWGVNYSKWNILAENASQAGYYPNEVPLLGDNVAKGAYEWLESLKEIDKWRKVLNDRLLEITYNQLTSQPQQTLENICQFLELEQPPSWLNQAVSCVRKNPPQEQKKIRLPEKMCHDFNDYQSKYQFINIAVTK